MAANATGIAAVQFEFPRITFSINWDSCKILHEHKNLGILIAAGDAAMLSENNKK